MHNVLLYQNIKQQLSFSIVIIKLLHLNKSIRILQSGLRMRITRLTARPLATAAEKELIRPVKASQRLQK